MKTSTELINLRRDSIFQELLNNSYVKVTDLAELFNVSELTIRRDLLYFEQKNLIERFYGGARVLNYHTPKHPSQNFQLIKHNLARKVAEFIDNGDTVFINTSSTAILVLKYLGDKHVTVVTNNGNALLSNYGKNITVILTGGELHPPKDSMTGDFAIQTITQIHANKAILGCSGFSIDGGMTTSVHREVSINQLMLKNCKGAAFVLADHTKLNRNANYSSGGVRDFAYLITDQFADPEFIKELTNETNVNAELVKISKDIIY